jgi:hypothetical protein
LDSAGDIGWTVGERVFVDRGVRQNLSGIGLRCNPVRVARTGAGGDGNGEAKIQG